MLTSETFSTSPLSDCPEASYQAKDGPGLYPCGDVVAQADVPRMIEASIYRYERAIYGLMMQLFYYTQLHIGNIEAYVIPKDASERTQFNE